MNDKIKKIIAIFLCLFTIDSFSQSNTFSPYSRFGLGTFSNNFSSYYQSMGGASTASLNSVYVNPSNPASYSLIKIYLGISLIILLAKSSNDASAPS